MTKDTGAPREFTVGPDEDELRLDHFLAARCPDLSRSRIHAEMAEAIRATIADLGGAEYAESVPVLYGGSVNPGNIKGFMAKRHIDVALGGVASLDPDTFAAVVRYWM